MAVLTDKDYGEIRDTAYRKGFGKEELKALPVLPSKAQLKAAFQSLETDLVAAYPGLKVNVETALGVSISASLMNKLLAAYLVWKIKQVLGA